METLLQVLMRCDELTETQALEQIEECRKEMLKAFEAGEDIEEIFTDFFGLEPDYILDIF